MLVDSEEKKGTGEKKKTLKHHLCSVIYYCSMTCTEIMTDLYSAYLISSNVIHFSQEKNLKELDSRDQNVVLTEIRAV